MDHICFTDPPGTFDQKCGSITSAFLPFQHFAIYVTDEDAIMHNKMYIVSNIIHFPEIETLKILHFPEIETLKNLHFPEIR